MAPKIFEGVLYPARSCTRFETYNILHSDFYERCTLLAWCAVTICSFTILIITKFRSFIFFFLGFRFKLCCIRLISVIITLSFCSYNTLSHDFVELYLYYLLFGCLSASSQGRECIVVSFVGGEFLVQMWLCWSHLHFCVVVLITGISAVLLRPAKSVRFPHLQQFVQSEAYFSHQVFFLPHIYLLRWPYHYAMFNKSLPCTNNSLRLIKYNFLDAIHS